MRWLWIVLREGVVLSQILLMLGGPLSGLLLGTHRQLLGAAWRGLFGSLACHHIPTLAAASVFWAGSVLAAPFVLSVSLDKH